MVGIGVGVLAGNGYAPEMSALTDLEGLQRQMEAGSVRLTADPFVIIVGCPDDPNRTESVALGTASLGDATNDMLSAFVVLTAQLTGLTAEEATDALAQVAAGIGEGDMEKTVQVGGYDIGLRIDENSVEAPLQLFLAVHREETANRAARDRVVSITPTPAPTAAMTAASTPKATRTPAPTPVPTPAVTPRPEILFRGIPYGTTFRDYITAIQEDNPYVSPFQTAANSWEYIARADGLYSAVNLQNGAYQFSCLADWLDAHPVAGLRLKGVDAWFLKAHTEDTVDESKDKATLYKATYTFLVYDAPKAYEMLKRKLTGLYGEGEERTGFSRSTWNNAFFTEDHIAWTTWYGGGNTGVYLFMEDGRDDSGMRRISVLTLTYGRTDSAALIRSLSEAMERAGQREWERLEQSAMNDVDGL